MSEFLMGILSGIIVTVLGGYILYLLINKVRVKSVTITKKQGIYSSSAIKGAFKFDYSNNKGLYVIGSGAEIFTTKWTKASDKAIYAYNDPSDIDSIALISNIGDIECELDLEGDFSSRSRRAEVGDAIVWVNKSGKKAITKIISITDSTRCDSEDQLECEYIIL